MFDPTAVGPALPVETLARAPLGLQVPWDALQPHFAALASIGRLEAGGYLRAGYSAEETAALRYVAAAGEEIGLRRRSDRLGNLVLEIPGREPDFVEAGSHLDTVPGGGNYDGAAGVLCGLEALRTVLRTGRRLRYGLRLRVWRCEESATFGTACVGSQAAFGRLTPEALGRRFGGRTLAEAMRAAGADPHLIEQGEPTISAAEKAGILAHFELHIEQGPVLERTGVPIGIVESIRGARRFRVEVEGCFDHSGTTPMGAAWRQDANLALATIVLELDRLAQLERARDDLTVTVTRLNTDREVNERDPRVYRNALTKVGGFGYCDVDTRSAEAAVLKAFYERAAVRVQEVAERFGVRAAVRPLGTSPGVPTLSRRLQDVLALAAEELGLQWQRLASGAGHDAAVVAAEGIPTAMLFVPCRGGRSHCAEEWASPEHLAAGASVLATAMGGLAL